MYLPAKGSVTNRIITVLLSGFGFIFSYVFGLMISVNPLLSPLFFGVFVAVLHWVILFYKGSAPGSFFFILLASISSCYPFDLEAIPFKVGLVSLNVLFTASVAIITVLLTANSARQNLEETEVKRNVRTADFWEAIMYAFFLMSALFVGKWLELDNPYWIPISCSAVMQGPSFYHIRQRTVQRILGTFIGLGLSWVLLHLSNEPIVMVLMIMALQFIIEVLISRQYVLAVIFITPMTILLSEAASLDFSHIGDLIMLRFYEICIGAVIGAIGGFVIHKELLRSRGIWSLRKVTGKK